ncbi:DUF2585 domain-containing protein [Vannielia sp.]|uniref:DUF2585 domain-containing protein n=1 Tax=Vannielia sp. TaxID=2813045 RepID=UPI00262BF8BB|nr:DUF2585 domain-containing protein [Vannielia sp.]MDF1872489.1 DUF2585 domain-containing protein [Vannielia sp.]
MIRKIPWGYVASALIVAMTAVVLLSWGREPICKCGWVKLWHFELGTSEGSQHILDWYTFSHVIHGILFFGLLWLVARRMPRGWRLAIATLVESAWELLENTETVIEHYRSVTISLDYYGDSVLNSVSDILAMWLGFLLARKLPVWASVVMVIGFEVFTTWMIRDGLALNVLMLLHPIEAVKAWQGAL